MTCVGGNVIFHVRVGYLTSFTAQAKVFRFHMNDFTVPRITKDVPFEMSFTAVNEGRQPTY